MNEITDLKMAVDATFSSILHEIQLSNLNFTLQITPFTAYITLKKSVLRDQNGNKAVPAPPVVLLLQQAQQTIGELQAANEHLKMKSDTAETTIENLVNENAVLVNAIDASKNDLATCNDKLKTAEQEIQKLNTLRNSCEASLKDMKKSHLKEINHAKLTIKSLEKSGKGLKKEIHNLNRNLENSRDSLKNLKSENSSLKIGKAKLETDKRKLEKLVNQKEFKINKLNQKEDIDLNKNYLEPEESAPSSYTPSLCSKSNLKPDYFTPASTSCPYFTSMIAHWNPLPVKNSTMSNPIISMVAHTVKSSLLICSNRIREKNIELEEKEDGFIGPRLPRLMTDDEFKALMRGLFPKSEKYK